MELTKMTPQDFTVTSWSGGKTTQIAIEPTDAVYADHSFDFRLSSATIELEESDFTPLPEYDRVIAPIKGQISLSYNGAKQPVLLHELECAVFDGAWQTRSHGKGVDYNLMTRKGVCTGNAYAVILGAGQSACISPCNSNPGRRSVFLLWCVAGTAQVACDEQSVQLCTQDAVRLDGENAGAVVCVQNAGDSPVRLMTALVSYL